MQVNQPGVANQMFGVRPIRRTDLIRRRGGRYSVRMDFRPNTFRRVLFVLYFCLTLYQFIGKNILRSPDAVLFPATTNEVSKIAKYCHSNRIPMIPFGLGSGFEGGITAPHGGVSIDLRRMNQGFHLKWAVCESICFLYPTNTSEIQTLQNLDFLKWQFKQRNRYYDLYTIHTGMLPIGLTVNKTVNHSTNHDGKANSND